MGTAPGFHFLGESIKFGGLNTIESAGRDRNSTRRGTFVITRINFDAGKFDDLGAAR